MIDEPLMRVEDLVGFLQVDISTINLGSQRGKILAMKAGKVRR